jgi:hypothetical protein
VEEEDEEEDEEDEDFCARATAELERRNAALRSTSRDEGRKTGITILVRRTPQVYGKLPGNRDGNRD